MNNREYTNCTRCDVKLRSNRLTVQQAPGTKPHAGNGLCASCRRRDRVAEQKAKAAAEKGIAPDRDSIGFDVDHARYALDSWLKNLPSRKRKAAA